LRTLLIDGDGRNPNVHKLFKITPGVGFGEVLCGECQPAEAIHATPVRGLAVMPAGMWSDKVLLAISQGRVAELMQQLRQDYDLILIDSSPVLPVADPLVIGQQVDGVLLSVLCQVTRLTNLYAASHRIEDLGINILGVVVSGVQANLYGASYRYPYPRRRTAAAQGEEKGGRA
jgi:polysaccharide biosynthesis transport protein